MVGFLGDSNEVEFHNLRVGCFHGPARLRRLQRTEHLPVEVERVFCQHSSVYTSVRANWRWHYRAFVDETTKVERPSRLVTPD